MRGAGRSVLAAALLVGAAVALAPASVQARGPRPNSDEYKKSWGLEAIGAHAAYDRGFTGKGVTVAIVDCGVAMAQREVLRNVSKLSTDVVPDRRLPISDPHGAYTAAPLAAALDGRGMVGVAYNATVLAVRADVEGGLNGKCAFRPSDLARAIDYAVAQKARVVVLPLQHDKPLGAPFEAALAHATAAGVAVVIAAGNREGPDPSWPAMYAVDPRFQGSIVVAGASSYYGALTTWSNRAGHVAPWFIAAPGEWVLTNCRAKCALVSGTSFSTSYVAGALALILEARPRITGREAIQEVLDGARDAGAPGVDDVYGHGILDLQRVFPAD